MARAKRPILKERVQARLDALKVSARAVSMRVAGQPNYVRMILNGSQQGTDADRALLLAEALQCSVAYLYGMAREPGEPPGVDLPDAPAPRSTVREISAGAGELVEIPEYDVRVSAGGGALIADEAVRRTWGLPRAFLDSIGVDARSVAFCEIVGDSMMPTLWPGDLILLDLRARNPAIPAIYALWDSDATVVKRVERVPGADPPRLRLISDNSAFTPYEVTAADVNVIGRVAWFGRRT